MLLPRRSTSIAKKLMKWWRKKSCAYNILSISTLNLEGILITKQNKELKLHPLINFILQETNSLKKLDNTNSHAYVTLSEFISLNCLTDVNSRSSKM